MKWIFTFLYSLVVLLNSNATTPTTPSTNLISSNVEGNSITFSWTNGNGASRLVIARPGSPVTAMPVNGIDYIANNTFGLGNEISTGQFVVYKGAGSNFGMTGLIPNTTYHIAVFEFNGTGFSTEYLTAAFLAGNRATLSAPATQMSNIVVSNVTGNSMQLNWTNGSGSSRIILAKAGSPVDANPVDLATYFANSQFGNGSQIGTGNYVVANGATSVTVVGLQPNTTYHFAGFEFNGSTGPVYLTVSPPVINQTTAVRPSVPSSNMIFSNVEGNGMQLAWTNGNGSKRIVIAKAGSPVTAVPVDGTNYTANSVFGSGQQIAPGEYVVLNGTQNFVPVSNLQHSTVYHYAVFEYDGTGAGIAYLTSSFLAGNRSSAIQPTVQTNNLAVGTVTNNSITLNWTNGNGSSRIILARQGSPVNTAPVNYTAYFPSQTFGNGTQIGTGNYVVYASSGNSATITGLGFGTTYHFAIFEFNGNSAPVYLTASPAVVNATTLNTPTIPSSNFYYNYTEGNSINIGWTAGNGTGRIMIAKAGGPVTGLPVNGTTYAASTVFGSGFAIAPGEFVITNSASSYATLTNLTPGTTYHFAVFEYNGSGASTSYLTSSFLTGNRTTLAAPTVQTVSITTSNIVGNAMQVNLAPGNGQNRIVLVKAGSPVNAAPANFSTYFPSSTFGGGTQIGSGNYVVFSGSQSSFTLTGLQPNTTYHFASFEYNGQNGPVYNTVSPALNNTTTGPRPTVPSGNVVFAYIEGNSIQFNWTTGNGTNRIVVARAGSPVTAVPVDGVNYPANSVFGSGTEISPGQFVIANNASNYVTATSLSIGTQYHFAIFEYDGTGSNIGYLTTSFAAATASTVSAPTVQTTNLLFTSITNTSMTLNWTNGNGAKRLVIARAGSPVTAIPTDLTAYFSSSNFPYAGQVTANNFAVFTGNTSSVNIFGLQPNTTYHFAIFEFNGNSAPVYLKTTPATGNATTVGAPQAQATGSVANAINSSAATISWANGSGHKRIVLMKANGAVDANPADGSSYTANTFFGSGTQLGSGNYTVFNGTGNNVTVTNLNLTNTYHVAVFEYNDFGGTTVLYLTINPSRAIVTLNAPQVQAGNAAANAVTFASAGINWANGNGHKRIVLMKENAPVDAVPADNITYAADTVFASGAQIGSGNYVVYNGTANTDTITGLNLANAYHIAVFEYNDFGVTLKRYQTNNPARTSFSGVPQLQASGVVVNNVNNTSAILGWTNGSGHKRIVLMKAGSPVDASPVDNTTYTANSVFGSGTQLGSGNYTVFSNSGNNVTVTGLTTGITYHLAVFEYNDFGGVSKLYLTISPARGTVITGSLPVTFIDFTVKEINKKAMLQWSTAQEFNSLRFEVERSSDGIRYVKIGSVNAAGSSTVRRDYSYTDNTVFAGKYYYRLKQVDADGQFVYSVVVNINIKNNDGFRLLENPVKDQLKLLVNDNRQKEFVVSVFDMAGKKVIEQKVKNQISTTVDISRLNAGIYVVQLLADKGSSSIKFMKTH